MADIRNSIEYKVYGKFALFSDPLTRPGGEKISYFTPTYQAIKGITESIYWKPTLIWYVDKIRVMNKIETESKGIRPIKMNNGGNDLAYYTYLRDVCYQVSAHFEWNAQRPELERDRDENKHHNIAKRSVEAGGRRGIFLGTSECFGYVEPCAFGEGSGHFDDTTELDFGVMFHGFNYPDETGENKLGVRLCRQVMRRGVIEFERPERVKLVRDVKDYGADYSFKRFEVGRNLNVS